MIYTNNIVHNCTYGHNLKNRARNSQIYGNRFYDGERGNVSTLIDIPSGGVHSVHDNEFHKGPNAQQQGAVQFLAEYYPTSDPQENVLTFNNNKMFLAATPYNHFGPYCAVRHYGRLNLTGGQSVITMDGNSFYMTNDATVLFETHDAGHTNVTVPTNSVTLATPPALNFARPGPADPSTPRLGFVQFQRDGSDNYANFYGVQIDPGNDDMRLPVNAAAGTVLGTFTAYGGNGFRNASLTDPRVNPFGTGTAWSISQAGQFNQFSSPLPWAPVGRYAIDATTGQLTVAGAARATSGIDFLKIRATGPTGVLCDTRIYISVG